MDKPQPKFFNTVGVCLPEEHYMLPVLPRIPDVNDMIDNKFYFILQAPRQSGKTTFLNALTDKINADGKFYAIDCSLASLRGIEDNESAMNTIASKINRALKMSSVSALKDLAYCVTPWKSRKPSDKVSDMLNYLSVSLDKDLVVFFDEADCLSGQPLIAFLSQITDGFLARCRSKQSKFPRSMALVGMRDIRDCLVQVRPKAESRAASPFNIKRQSLTLANFTHEEIKILYGQHTEAAGQIFTDAAIERAWHWTEGQPWLVNALADEVVVKQFKNDYAKVINDSDIDKARHCLILRNDTHLDYLRERIKEPRVRRVMEAVVIGASVFPPGISTDDVQYTVDLGLLKLDPCDSQVFLPANPIYKEIIVSTLTENIAKLIKNKDLDAYSRNR
jgi:hypothetical protein